MFFVLTSSTIFTQILSIVSYPVITHLFSASDYGEYGVMLAVISLVGGLSTLRYEQAIPLVKEEQVVDFVRSLFIILVVISILFAIAAPWLAVLFQNKFLFLQRVSSLIVIPVFFLGCYQIVQYLFIRYEHFTYIAIGDALLAFLILLGQILLGLAGFSAGGLFYPHVVASLAAIIAIACILLYSKRIKKLLAGPARIDRNEKDDSANRRQFDLKNGLKVLSEFRIFSFNLSLGGLACILVFQLPVILFSLFYSTQVAGLLILAQYIIRMPLTIVGQSISKIFYSKTSELYREQGLLKETYFKTVAILALIGLPLFVAIWILCPIIIPLFFGQDWQGVTLYVHIMLPMFFVEFILSPVSYILAFCHKTSWQLFWDWSRLALITAAILIAHYFGFTSAYAIQAYSATLCFTYCILFFAHVLALRNSSPENIAPRFDLLQ